MKSIMNNLIGSHMAHLLNYDKRQACLACCVTAVARTTVRIPWQSHYHAVCSKTNDRYYLWLLVIT
jgi:hypothetical protein